MTEHEPIQEPTGDESMGIEDWVEAEPVMSANTTSLGDWREVARRFVVANVSYYEAEEIARTMPKRGVDGKTLAVGLALGLAGETVELGKYSRGGNELTALGRKAVLPINEQQAERVLSKTQSLLGIVTANKKVRKDAQAYLDWWSKMPDKNKHMRFFEAHIQQTA